MKHLLALAVMTGFSASASANLLSNPSFEILTGTFGGDGGAQLISTSTTLTGWTIARGETAQVA